MKKKLLMLLPIFILVFFMSSALLKPASLPLFTTNTAVLQPATIQASVNGTTNPILESVSNLSVEHAYTLIDFKDHERPNLLCFAKSFEAYKTLVANDVVENFYLTIVDFSLSSVEKRLWVIDMQNYQVVLNSLVAHGQKSGDEFATQFSNINNSHQSSLGIFLTGEVYTGRNGLSLRLDGLNARLNGLARSRGIVIHGADYVSESFIESNGRLGRSQGCPAVSTQLNADLIDLIKEKSVLFIYHPSLESSVATQPLKKLNLQGIEKRNI